jgi:AraC family transcriptional regulator
MLHNRPDWEGFSENKKLLLAISQSNQLGERSDMDVAIVTFANTPIAALEHHGPERLVYETSRKFIGWRQRMGIKPQNGDTYGLHYSSDGSSNDYRFDISVSFAGPIEPNPEGIVSKLIPEGRCAKTRHIGSRDHIPAADFLYRQWLPASGEELRDFPFFFHYLNVGPDVRDKDMVTDLYLPIC